MGHVRNNDIKNDMDKGYIYRNIHTLITIMSKEEQNLVASKIQQHYTCNIIKNNEDPFVLFRAADICKILDISNTCKRTNNLSHTDRVLIKSPTDGGDQTMIFLTYIGLLKVLSTTRKPKLMDFSTKIGIEVYTRFFACVESDTIKCILDAFSGETMIQQHRVANYKIDLYFPKYNLAVECDEPHHNTTSIKQYDESRECHIKTELVGCEFIRYKPFDPQFSIFKLISEIHAFITNHTNEIIKKHKNEIQRVHDTHELEKLKMMMVHENETHKLQVEKYNIENEKYNVEIKNIQIENEKHELYNKMLDIRSSNLQINQPASTTNAPESQLITVPTQLNNSGLLQATNSVFVRTRNNVRSPKVYQYDPVTLDLIQIYDSIITFVRHFNSSSACALKEAGKSVV